MIWRAIVAAVVLLTLSFNAQASEMSDAIAKCGTKGVVLASPTDPKKILKTLCEAELKTLSCQPLAYIRNYILYANGMCMNNDRIYGAFFSRKECIGIDYKKHNNPIFDKLPFEVNQMINLVVDIEFKKSCLPRDAVIYW